MGSGAGGPVPSSACPSAGTPIGTSTQTQYTGLTFNYSGTVTKPSADTRVYEYTQNYSGTVTKPAVDTRVYEYHQLYNAKVFSQTVDNREYGYTQNYSGTVNSPSVDTRIWRQDYEGMVYKGENEIANPLYSYSVNLIYQVQNATPGTCTYKNVSPASIVATNFTPKCVTLSSGASLYNTSYDFNVSGVSSSGK